MNGPTALREAVTELRGRAGLLLLLLFATVGAATVVAQQTLTAAATGLVVRSELSAAQFPLDPTAVETPLSLGLPYVVALTGVLAIALVAEYAAIVTLRVVTGSRLRKAATRRVGRTLIVGFLAGAIVRTLVAIGLTALVLPGLFLAVSLLFVHPAVAVDDASIREAFATAWSLASGRRIAIASVLSLLLVLYLTPRLIGSVIPGAAGLLVGGAAAGVGGLLSSGVVGRAYLAAKRDAAGETESTDETADPYDAPLGADDLPEPE